MAVWVRVKNFANKKVAAKGGQRKILAAEKNELGSSRAFQDYHFCGGTILGTPQIEIPPLNVPPP
jgi:hypothetical protein